MGRSAQIILKSTRRSASAVIGLLDLLGMFCRSEKELLTSSTVLLISEICASLELPLELMKGKLTDPDVVDRMANDIFEFAKERIEKEARQATSSN